MTAPNCGGVGDATLPHEPVGFREFVETRSGTLQRAAWLLTGDWQTAEDLMQSALAAAWPRWSSLTHPGAPERYVRRIMLTTFLRWRRRRWNGEISVGDLPEPPENVDPLRCLRRSPRSDAGTTTPVGAAAGCRRPSLLPGPIRSADGGDSGLLGRGR